MTEIDNGIFTDIDGVNSEWVDFGDRSQLVIDQLQNIERDAIIFESWSFNKLILIQVKR